MVKPEDLTLDQILYNAVLYLIQNDHQEAAELLIECELDGYQEDCYTHWNGYEVEWSTTYTLVTLSAPHALQPKLGASVEEDKFTTADKFYAKTHPIQAALERAFEATLRVAPVLYRTYVQLITESQGDWREHLRQLATGEKVSNQGNPSPQRKPVVVWNNLNFCSNAEKAIAEALDRKGVMYLPNCMARLGPPEHRHNKEPDFLVCLDGKWGILEVDGKAYHQEAAQDHERDRQFRRYGIKVIERFSGKRCYDGPDEVVDIFMRILQQNG
jgi:hypothetical protein